MNQNAPIRHTCPRCDFTTLEWSQFDKHMSVHNKEDADRLARLEIEELQQQVKTLQAQVKALLDAVPSAKVETE